MGSETIPLRDLLILIKGTYKLALAWDPRGLEYSSGILEWITGSQEKSNLSQFPLFSLFYSLTVRSAEIRQKICQNQPIDYVSVSELTTRVEFWLTENRPVND